MLGWVETAWHYIMRGFGVIFPPQYRNAPYHLTPFPRSQRLYHMKLYIALFPVLHWTICDDVLHPLYIILVLRGMQVKIRRKAIFCCNDLPQSDLPTAAAPTHSVQNGPRISRPSRCDQVGRQQPKTTLWWNLTDVPPCVFLVPSMPSWLNQSDSCAFTFSVMSTSEFDHKLGSHVKENDIHPTLM